MLQVMLQSALGGSSDDNDDYDEGISLRATLFMTRRKSQACQHCCGRSPRKP